MSAQTPDVAPRRRLVGKCSDGGGATPALGGHGRTPAAATPGARPLTPNTIRRRLRRNFSEQSVPISPAAAAGAAEEIRAGQALARASAESLRASRAQPKRQPSALSTPPPGRGRASRAPQPLSAIAESLVGAVVDITYEDPPATFRAAVVGYNAKTGWHSVDSKGLSTWDGEDFKDQIDAGAMAANGQLKVVGSVGAATPVLPSAGRGRGRGAGPAGLSPDYQPGSSATWRPYQPASRRASPKPQARAAPAAPAAVERLFGEEIVGRIVDVRYPRIGMFRVMVVGYVAAKGWHKVDSTGLSFWEGESFTDTVNLSAMSGLGQISFVSSSGTSVTSAPPRVPSGKGRVWADGRTDEDVVGDIVDITYDDEDPPATYRVEVLSFDHRTRVHRVESSGPLGLWDGEVFSDTVDLMTMHSDGLVAFVAEGGVSAGRAAKAKAAPKGTPKAKGKAKAAPKAAAAAGRSATGRFAARGPLSAKLLRERGLALMGVRPAAGPAAGRGRAGPKAKAGAKGRARGRGASTRGASARAAAGPQKAFYGADICGHVVDLAYPNEEGGTDVFRVRVLSYDQKTRWHTVNSKGLSSCEGEDFSDTVDLNQMVASGQVEFLTHVLPTDALQVVCETPRGGRGGRFSEYMPVRGRGPGLGRGRRPAADPASGEPAAKRGRRSRAGAPSGVQEASSEVAPSTARASASSAPAPARGYGAELVERTLDVEFVASKETFRVVVQEFDEMTGRHRVDCSPFGDKAFPGGEQDESGGTYWADLNGMIDRGWSSVEFVDGMDDLCERGHALVGEEIRFLPEDAPEAPAPGEAPVGEEEWRSAKIVGWWPQDVLPPVATEGAGEGDRRAVFVAQELNGEDRWQLSLGDAMMAVATQAPRGFRPRALLEVFAGPCELSLACRRLGLEAEPYDVNLSSGQDFAADEDFVRRLREAAPWDLVHFREPPGLQSEGGEEELDLRVLPRMLEALEHLHGAGRGFVVEAGESSPLWQTEEMEQVENLSGMEALSLDLQDFGAPRPAATRLLTNRGNWFARALAGPSEARRPANTKRGSDRYPRAFCDAYAQALLAATSPLS